MFELQCPEACRYLKPAREQAVERERELRSKEMPIEGRRRYGLDDSSWSAITLIDRAIIDYQRSLDAGQRRRITDEDVLEAVETVIRNLETADSGIIYHHRAVSPIVESISAQITKSLEELSGQKDSGQPILPADVTKALNYERDVLRAHVRRGGEGRDTSSYIRQLSLFIPWPEESAGPIII
jgi:hypothetical protein